MSSSILDELEAVLQDRLDHAAPESYSAPLLRDPVRAQRKIMEEAFEVCLELNRDDVDVARTASEAADLLFHLIAGLVGAGVPVSAVLDELSRRRSYGARA